MNKKILIGSIIAICILIGVSFTSVVGYRSVTSDVKASPLFNIRSSRAIDEKSGDLSCAYIGKGEGTNIYLPEINDDSESIDALINAVRWMDDKSLRSLASLIIYQIHQTDDNQELDYEEIFLSLKQLRHTPDGVIQKIKQRKGSIMMSNICTLYCATIFECLPFVILVMLLCLAIIAYPIIKILSLLTLSFCNQ